MHWVLNKKFKLMSMGFLEPQLMKYALSSNNASQLKANDWYLQMKMEKKN